MRYTKLSDILEEIDEIDLEEVSCKVGLHFHDIEDKKEIVLRLAKSILENAEILLRPYSKDTLKFLNEICTCENKSKEFDMEYNVLVCDGLCFLEKVDGVEMIKVTEDFASSFCEMYSSKENLKKQDMYDEMEKIIIGIIKLYGIINSDEIYNIFLNLKKVDEKEFEDNNEFEHFLFHRDGIIRRYEIFSHHDEEYFFIEEIENPDEVIHELLESDENYVIYSRDKYIEFSNGNDFITDEKTLDDFKEYIYQLTNNNERQTLDIVNTVMYDIKIGNLDDLMLDIMTYIDISTNEEHEEIKNKLSNLYERTPNWFGRYFK